MTANNRRMRDEMGDMKSEPRDGGMVVAAVFKDRLAAEQAINDLKAAGLRGDQISVAMRDRTEQGELIEDTGTHAASGAVKGAVGGGVLGGLVGFLVGVGALVIPGVGPVIAAGALASALGTAGATAVAGAGIGAATGGLLGALVGMGIPEERARHFESRFREGGVLVTAKVYEGVERAREILERNGGDTAMHLEKSTGSDRTVR